MKHETQARYPALSEKVIRMFTDRRYHEQKMQSLGIEFSILDYAFDGDELRLKTKRMLPVQASGIAGRFLPSRTEVVNEEFWRISDKSGSVSVETRGVPLRMSCTASMRDEADECVITYEWDIKAKVPMGAGALEKFVIKDMAGREAKEHDAAIALLDDYC